ncbi:unnamed protein product, partial [Polarella glacialis]
ELAVEAVHRNPKLLQAEALKIKKVIPALMVSLGGPEEAAYALATRPELLELARPVGIKESVKVVCDSLCNMQAALTMVAHTNAPPSIKVCARMFCREDLVGEHFKVDGGQVDGRPVWCKPASSMAFLRHKAKDVFIIYSAVGVPGMNGENEGAGCWTFTESYDSSRSKSLKGTCDSGILGWAFSDRDSPDQVPGPQIPHGHWHFRQEGKPAIAWECDPHVEVEDGGFQRGAWFAANQPPELRHSFTVLKECIGLVWREAEHGVAANFVASPLLKDLVHSGGTAIFKDLGGFKPANGFVYIQLPADLPSDASPLVLTAWEPVQILLLYCNSPEVAAPAAEAVAQPVPAKGGKGKGDPAGEAPPTQPPEPSVAELLEGEGYRKLSEHMPVDPLPELIGAPQLGPDIFVRGFPRGRAEVPLFLGPGRRPPLIFIRQQVSAISRGGTPCQMLKAKADEELFYEAVETAADKAAALVPVVEVDKKAKAAPKKGEVVPEIEEVQKVEGKPCIVSAGELGYTGFLFFRSKGMEDLSCEVDETQLNIDTLEKLKVAVAWFPVPPETPRKASPPGSKEASPEASRSHSKEEELPEPDLPDWVRLENGWRPYESRIPLVIKLASGKLVTALHLCARDVEANQVFALPGSGSKWMALVMWKQTSANRQDTLRRLLLREPALLAAGDKVQHLVQRLRHQLGDSLARDVLTSGALALPANGAMPATAGTICHVGVDRTKWPKLCQVGDASAIDAWIFEHKIEAQGCNGAMSDFAPYTMVAGLADGEAELLPDCELAEVVTAAGGGDLDDPHPAPAVRQRRDWRPALLVSLLVAGIVVLALRSTPQGSEQQPLEVGGVKAEVSEYQYGQVFHSVASGFAQGPGYQAGQYSDTKAVEVPGYQAGHQFTSYGSGALGYQAGRDSAQHGSEASRYQSGHYSAQHGSGAAGYQADQYSAHHGPEASGYQAGHYSAQHGSGAAGYQAGQYSTQHGSEASGYQARHYSAQHGSGAAGYQAGQHSAQRGSGFAGYQAGHYSTQHGSGFAGYQAGQYSAQRGSGAAGYQAGQYSAQHGSETSGYQAGHYSAQHDSGAAGYQAGQYSTQHGSEASGYQAGHYSAQHGSGAAGYQAGHYLAQHGSEASGYQQAGHQLASEVSDEHAPVLVWSNRDIQDHRSQHTVTT